MHAIGGLFARGLFIRGLFALVLIAGLFAAPPASAQLLDLLTAPKTLFDRAIEARSTKDIFEDNGIVIAVNKLMADLGTLEASTEIYEQRLLVTGLFDDREVFDKFLAAVKKIDGVKKLYWHVGFMSEQDQEKNKETLLDWGAALALDTKVGINLVATRGVADVNFRVAVDSFGAVYLIGRARSEEELKKALAAARETGDVKKVVNYVEVRP